MDNSKKAMKLLLSVSAISFFFFYVPFLIPFLINPFSHVYVSAFSKTSSFNFTFNKNCVFLLFNGILVIIMTNSGLIGKSPELNSKNGTSNVVNWLPETTTVRKTTRVRASLPTERIDVSGGGDDDDEGKDSRDVSIKNKALVPVAREEEVSVTEGGKEIIVFDNEINEVEEEGEIELQSTEDEFNKKCEEFIRRVKEEIKFGAR